MEQLGQVLTAIKAVHDQLTGLPNRLHFERSVSSRVPARRQSVGLMQVDLDGFKAINDTYGHAAGDHVLQVVAARLRMHAMPLGMPFRNGGDEFIIICNQSASSAEVEQLAQTIVAAISKPISWRETELTIGASIGVAFPLEGQQNIMHALEEADAALYAAKQNGKGQVVLSDSFLAACQNDVWTSGQDLGGETDGRIGKQILLIRNWFSGLKAGGQ